MEQKTEQSYLSRIVFDQSLTKGLVAGWIKNVRIIILLVMSLLVFGLVSYFNIPRRLNPEIKIPIIIINTVMPGASPEDIESLITIPLESSLENLKGIDTISSSSRDSVSTFTLQFTSTTSQDKAKADAQSIVDSFTSLPKEAQTPKVMALDFEDQPIWTFAITTDDSLPSLMRVSENLKKALEETPKVDRVTLSGYEERQIEIRMKEEKIRDYQVNPITLSAAVKAVIGSYPAGSVKNSGNTFALTIDPTATTIADLRAIRINVNGTLVKLGDIADIFDGPKNDNAPAFYANQKIDPQRSVTISVYKTSQANFDESEKLIKQTLEKQMTPYKDHFKIVTIQNSAEEINKQFFELLGEFRSTILLVMICLFLFLGVRQALISSLTVPLTFLSAFIFMRFFGMTINFLTLFAFLIALGLLVDDTIVTVQSMTTYYKTGKFTPYETGLLVWRDLIIPIWSTTITTIWSFVPLLLTSGIIGEFIKPIPVVVTITMLSSTAIAVLITLPAMIILLKPEIPYRVLVLGKLLGIGITIALFIALFQGNILFVPIAIVFILVTWLLKKAGNTIALPLTEKLTNNSVYMTLTKTLKRYADHGVIDLTWVSNTYSDLIKKVITSKRNRRGVIIAIVVYALWAFALLPMGFVKNEFFPKTDQKILSVTVEVPPGSSTDKITDISKNILTKLKNFEYVEYATLVIGEGASSRFSSSQSKTTALITLNLGEPETRKKTSYDIAEQLRKELKTITEANVSVAEASSGPPAGADVAISLNGDDLQKLNDYADQIVTHLQSQPGVTNIEKSLKSGTSKIVFVPDMVKLTNYQVSVDAIGLWLRTYASGFTLTDVRFDKTSRDKEDIVFTIGGLPNNPEGVLGLMIPTQSGTVPLSELGTVTVKFNPVQIQRESGKRVVSVTASARPTFVATELQKELVTYATSMKFDDGYTWKTGGANEENAKSITSILQSMLLAFLLIMVTMVIQFQSYRQAAIVLMVIPLAVSSVFVAFALTGTPLSFPALIGVLSLFGIVVTNSMFIVDKININLREHMPFTDALADAGASRLEPIILTKLCTVMGLLPITLSNPLWRGLGGAIISGILLASTIMLLFIPAVYTEWFGEKK